MPLDPHAQRLLRMLSVSSACRDVQTVENRRRDLLALAELAGGPAPPMAAVEDLTCAGPGGALRLRRYQPSSSSRGAIVFVHGGGWVAGDLETHDGVCRRLAAACERQVFAVDYRRPPEAPFPASLNDTAAAFRWVQDQAASLGIDPTQVALAGDSAGGQIAAATVLDPALAVCPALLLLLCPILDLSKESASRVAFADGYFLSRSTLERDLANYAPGEDRCDPRLSPLLAENLSILPPTHIHVAEFDPFRDEGLAFAARAKATGSTVEVTVHAGMIHYFYALPSAIPYAETALRDVGDAVRRALPA